MRVEVGKTHVRIRGNLRLDAGPRTRANRRCCADCGYLGKNDKFDSALTIFAASYAEQPERDHAALLKAIRAGRVKAGDSAAV
jgi:hypothetical protein